MPKRTRTKHAPMNMADAARIKSATARSMDGRVPAGSFGARAERAAAKNASAARGAEKAASSRDK